MDEQPYRNDLALHGLIVFAFVVYTALTALGVVETPGDEGVEVAERSVRREKNRQLSAVRTCHYCAKFVDSRPLVTSRTALTNAIR